MKLMAFFSSMTGAKVKDCISNEKVVFIMEENEMGKAIGKSGINIKRMENKIKRRVKVVEFSSNAVQFVRNIIHPIEVLDIEEQDDAIIIHGRDSNTKAMLIGRERRNLTHLNELVKRHFNIKEIKVV